MKAVTYRCRDGMACVAIVPVALSTLTVSLVLKWLAPFLVILRTVCLCLDTFTDKCFIWADRPVRMRIVERAHIVGAFLASQYA